MIELQKQVNEFKASEEGVIEGYASVFNEVDSYGDTILPEAYDNVIASKKMPLMFFNHDWLYNDTLPIGKWTAMEKDEHGLKLTGQFNLALQKARDIYESLKFGSLNGLSVGMVVDEDNYEKTARGRHTIKEVSVLREVSVVNFPADDFARITSVKSIEEIATIRDFEKYLRDAGISKSQAVALVAAAKKVFAPQSDSASVELKSVAERLNALTKNLHS